jgi:hypothetical protein
MRTLLAMALAGTLAGSSLAAPAAWIRFDSSGTQHYQGVPYHFLGDSPLSLAIEAAPTGAVLDLLWGAKNDQRGALVTVNGAEQRVSAGGYDGFKWQRVPLAGGRDAGKLRVELRAAAGGQEKAAFIAALRLTSVDSPLEEPLPDAPSKDIALVEPPPSELDLWARELLDQALPVERRALIHGMQASEALRRCRKYIDGWLAHCDPITGLVPRNLGGDKHLWNGKDSAADNYPFMVLTAALTDRALYDGRMLDILRTEQRVATRMDGLPATYDFKKQSFRNETDRLATLIFDGSEYVKDGLMPITEWLGDTPWSVRMTGIVDSILRQAEFETPQGRIPADNIEVNGEMMQVLSRLCFRYDSDAYLDMACRIADYYLLGEHHPTRNATRLQLRDHNCELISGLTEVYAACFYRRKPKAAQYREPIHRMLDDILRTGLNEHGLMYNRVNPATGEILDAKLSDNWGYNYNGFYTIYLLDGVERYREAPRRAMSNLKEHYWKYPWEGWSSDGIADSVEGAINLLNREPDVAGVPEWIDANINRMLDIQKPDGVIEGWHGDGNYARTAIMWALWKQQGVTIQPWRADVKIGAVREGGALTLALRTETSWSGRVLFDQPRHRTFMKLPLDYPRINQFPEWYTVDAAAAYTLSAPGGTARHSGSDLIRGVPLELAGGSTTLLKVQQL